MRHQLLKSALLLCALIAGFSCAWAEDVTFTAGTDVGSNGTSGNPDSMSKNGITISGTDFATTTAEYRIYLDCSLTISSTVGNITKIVITSTANKGSDYGPDKISTSTGTYTTTSKSKIGTWTGSATSVTFTASAQCRAISIVVTNTAPSVPSSALSFSEKTPSIVFPGATTYLQAPSIASGYNGTITYELSNNTAGATIDEEGTVTVTQGGSVTVTATAAAVEGLWLSSSDSYTLTVTDTRTAAPISFSPATAEAMMGEDFEEPTLTNPQNLTVTYSSDNEAVATADAATGAVTLVAPGTAHIIATFAGNASYKNTTVQYTLTVHKGAQTLPYTESFANTFGEFTYDGAQADGVDIWSIKAGYIQASSYTSKFHDGESWLTSPVIKTNDVAHVALSFEHAIDDSFGTIANEAVVYAKNVGDEFWTKLSINYPATPSSGYSNFITTTVDLSDFAGSNIQIAFFYKGTETKAGSWRIKNLKVYVSAEDVTVSTAGLSTFASDNALDFTNVENLEAYIAKENGNDITLQQVNKVPAGTGVLLRAKNDATNFVVPFTTAATDDITGNIFHRGTGAAVATGSGPFNWILSTKDGVVGFYHANGNTVATNHAYLTTTSANARIDLTFGEETAIRDVNSQTAEGCSEVYDLQGRRVIHSSLFTSGKATPARGLYIVNGKKAIIK